MSTFLFSVWRPAKPSTRGLVKPDRHGRGIFMALGHQRGTLTRERARKLVDWINDELDRQEQHDHETKEQS